MKSFFLVSRASCVLISAAMVSVLAQASAGKTYIYKHEIVQHGEYTVDACQLRVIGADGVPLYSEFKGEYWESDILCGGLKLNESVSYQLSTLADGTAQCVKLNKIGAGVEKSSLVFCGGH